MASNTATLATFFPKDVNVYAGGQAPIKRIGPNGIAALVFGKNPAAPDASVPEYVEFDFIIPKTASTTGFGYTATTGIKLLLYFASATGAVTGAVRWVGNIALIGNTDLPVPTTDIWSSTYEIAANTTISSTAKAVTVCTLNMTIASIQGAQTTAPAAGDICRLRIRREIGHASDTMAGDAYLFAIEARDY